MNQMQDPIVEDPIVEVNDIDLELDKLSESSILTYQENKERDIMLQEEKKRKEKRKIKMEQMICEIREKG